MSVRYAILVCIVTFFSSGMLRLKIFGVFGKNLVFGEKKRRTVTKKRGGKGRIASAPPAPPTAQLHRLSAAEASTRVPRTTPHSTVDRPIALTHAALASIVEAAVQSALAAIKTTGKKETAPKTAWPQ
ncbi:unnamed protein product [Leptosia nina]|uniref:Uncharacterized protein n=1 Tax=Leptosia nina TaxID=320188 RepID=A0AAV1IVJ7_9NEOP